MVQVNGLLYKPSYKGGTTLFNVATGKMNVETGAGWLNMDELGYAWLTFSSLGC